MKIRNMLLVVCLLAASLVLMGAAPSIKVYNEKLNVIPNGSGKVTTQLEMTDILPGSVDIPLSTWNGIQDLRWEGGPAGLQIQPVLKGDNPYLKVVVPAGAPASFTLRLEFDVLAPKAAAVAKVSGNERAVSYRFLNTGQLPVAQYRLTTILPEGETVHSVQEALPKGKAGSGAQVKIINAESRQGFTLEAQNLKFGDASSISLKIVPEKKSPVMLVVGIFFAIAYLYAFRDIVRNSTDDNRPAAKKTVRQDLG
ncbi:hypothetical protein SRRS_14330 [Sporomusa rhizae]|uniref:hypothetical protein n=1 Tax=Sporomusa rhizae TaxID=357999 RepID=UPI00352AB37B